MNQYRNQPTMSFMKTDQPLPVKGKHNVPIDQYDIPVFYLIFQVKQRPGRT